MTRMFAKLMGLLLVLLITVFDGWAETRSRSERPEADAEPMYAGKPLSYWLKSIQDENAEMELAFEAITVLGPDARTAISGLIGVVNKPFKPIRTGVDDINLMTSKLLDIQRRGEAIDALTAIGEPAASSSVPLIDWALTVKVIPPEPGDFQHDSLFINLVALDILQRMRVAGAVAQFGPDAWPAVAVLLTAPDEEKRKLAVAILSENALPIAAALLKSKDCDEAKLGIAILSDMWPVVSKDHLTVIKANVICSAD